MKHLGFCLNLEEMTVTLPEETAGKNNENMCRIKTKGKVYYKGVSQVIGQLVSAFPAMQWYPLYYRSLETILKS